MDGAPSAIVIVIDRLGAGYLGPYGSTWVETPALNHFASQSLLCEHAIVDSPALQTVYRSFWSGAHAMAGACGSASEALAAVLGERKVHAALVTDDPQVAEHPLAAAFAERVALPALFVDSAAEEIEQTQFAQLIAAALDWLDQRTDPYLLWLHSAGMQGPWDAPQEFRSRLAEEDDPPPPEFVTPPDLALADDFDPDELLGLVHAYAGQLAVVDLCLGALLDAIENRRGSRPLVALTAPRGFPLGEHLLVGAAGDALQGEVLHVPWMLKFPDGRGAAMRTQAIVQPPDLHAALFDWFGALAPEKKGWGRSILPLVEGAPPAGFDRAASVDAGARSLRTPAWFYCERADGRQSLYRKPDDRWEVNEVADRCQSVVEQCAVALERFQQAAAVSDRGQLPPLGEELIEGLD